MLRPRTVGDLFPTRRELLKFGGLGLVGASVDAIWPLRVGAANIGSKPHPRGNAEAAALLRDLMAKNGIPVPAAPAR